VAGITDAELDEINDHVAEVRVWPASELTIEEWDTHTVVFDHLGYRTTIYDLGTGRFAPDVLWGHTFATPCMWAQEKGWRSCVTRTRSSAGR